MCDTFVWIILKPISSSPMTSCLKQQTTAVRHMHTHAHLHTTHTHSHHTHNMHTHTLVYTSTQTNVHVVHTHTHTHTNKHTQTNTHTQTHTHTHTHTHLFQEESAQIAQHNGTNPLTKTRDSNAHLYFVLCFTFFRIRSMTGSQWTIKYSVT